MSCRDVLTKGNASVPHERAQASKSAACKRSERAAVLRTSGRHRSDEDDALQPPKDSRRTDSVPSYNDINSIGNDRISQDNGEISARAFMKTAGLGIFSQVPALPIISKGAHASARKKTRKGVRCFASSHRAKTATIAKHLHSSPLAFGRFRLPALEGRFCQCEVYKTMIDGCERLPIHADTVCDAGDGIPRYRQKARLPRHHRLSEKFRVIPLAEMAMYACRCCTRIKARNPDHVEANPHNRPIQSRTSEDCACRRVNALS